MPDDVLVRSITALHTYVAGDESLGDTLTHIATITAAAVSAEMAGLTLLQADGRFGTPVYTHPVVPVVDQAQYEADRGPCVDAFRTKTLQRIESTDADDRWPEYDAAAREHGIHSTLSLPLVVNHESIGALNLYSLTLGHFDERAEQLGTLLADQAAVAVANATAYWGKATLAHNLSLAMQSRATIEQAKGVIMATVGCTPDDAFQLLRIQSQTENRKLRDVAQEIVDQQNRDRPA